MESAQDMSARARAEAVVNDFIMATKNSDYTVIEGDDAEQLILNIAQALQAERQAALREAANAIRESMMPGSRFAMREAIIDWLEDQCAAMRGRKG